jgi:uncharacterized membrane protein
MIAANKLMERSSQNVWLRYLSLLLVVIGIGVSGYLSYVKLADERLICTQSDTFQCDVVQNSAYAEMFGIPIAYLGLGTYLVIGVLLLLEDRLVILHENDLLIVFGIVLFAFVYSIYLVYLQGWVLQAWCQWCLTHEVNMTILFIVTILRLRHHFAE